MQMSVKNIKIFLSQQSGSAAIEFALLVVPATFIIAGIFEISLMLGAQSLLQSATSEATREIRTGKLQSASDEEEKFKEIICNKIDIMMDCGTDNDKIMVDVLDVNKFSDAKGNNAQFKPDGSFESQGFDLPDADSTVLVRTVYLYPLKTPFIKDVFADGPNGDTRVFVSTNVIQTEPYEF